MTRNYLIIVFLFINVFHLIRMQNETSIPIDAYIDNLFSIGPKEIVQFPKVPKVPSISHYIQLANITGIPFNSVASVHPNHHRIVGGHLAYIRRYPWQVSVIINNYFSCGGSIIARRWVLTAGHCIVNYRAKYAVRAGSTYFRRGGKITDVVSILRHSSYKPLTLQNDIALLELRRPLVWSPTIKPVRLPFNRRIPSILTVTGWGTTSENVSKPSRHLRAVTVRKVNHIKCQKTFARFRIKITDKMFCAYADGRDSCQGDSGGAIVRHGYQYGIVSFGEGCARKNSPGVYTNVRPYLPWILKTMKINKK